MATVLGARDAHVGQINYEPRTLEQVLADVEVIVVARPAPRRGQAANTPQGERWRILEVLWTQESGRMLEDEPRPALAAGACISVHDPLHAIMAMVRAAYEQTGVLRSPIISHYIPFVTRTEEPSPRLLFLRWTGQWQLVDHDATEGASQREQVLRTLRQVRAHERDVD